MKYLNRYIISFLLFFSFDISSALDLKETIILAQQHDMTYQAAYANYLAVSEESTQSMSAVLPQVEFNAYLQRGRTENDQSGVVTSSDNNGDGYSLNLNQILYDKTILDNLAQGDAIVAKAAVDLETAKQDSIIRTATAYFDVLTAIDTLETASAEKKAIGRQLQQSKERFDVGLAAITDVKEQQASYDIATADEIIATNDLSNKREALRFIISIYPQNLKIAREDIPLIIPVPADIDTWQEKALKNNFSMQSTKYAVNAAQSAYDGSKGGHYPTLSLNASYGVNNNDSRLFSGIALPENESADTTVMLNLKVPIYSGGLSSSKVRQKFSQLEQAKALNEQEKRRTIALSRSAYLSLVADIAQVKARKQAVISTQSSLDASLAGYDAGTRTSVDVLLSQRLLFGSQRDYSAARYRYLIDSLKLKQVTGILSLSDVNEVNKWLIEKPLKPE